MIVQKCSVVTITLYSIKRRQNVFCEYTHHQSEYLTLHSFTSLQRYLSAKLNQRGQESFEFGVVSKRVGRRAQTCSVQKKKKNRGKVRKYYIDLFSWIFPVLFSQFNHDKWYIMVRLETKTFTVVGTCLF